MKHWERLLLFELWFLVGMPVLCIVCFILPAASSAESILVFLAQFAFVFMWFFWLWQWFAYAQYRHCRQEEFLFLLQTAAATNAPVEQVLRAYLADRPRERMFRFILLFFVFPGYYFIHIDRSFDARLRRLLKALEQGVPLVQALAQLPGIAARETAVAASVGQYSGKFGQAMKRLPEGRSTAIWLELAPRLAYPVLLLGFMAGNVMFLMIFIIPKFEKIFSDFKMRLPYATEFLVDLSRWCEKYWYVLGFFGLLALGVCNAMLYSSQMRWHLPVLGALYRMKARGEFLQILGIMLETGKPLREVLERMLDSNQLPAVVHGRVKGLLADLMQGAPLTENLVRHGLASKAEQGLIASAEKANHLAWALQELGDTLVRRSARFAFRVVAVAFPLLIFSCAGLVAFVAVSLFLPLTHLLGGLSGG